MTTDSYEQHLLVLVGIYVFILRNYLLNCWCSNWCLLRWRRHFEEILEILFRHRWRWQNGSRYRHSFIISWYFRLLFFLRGRGRLRDLEFTNQIFDRRISLLEAGTSCDPTIEIVLPII